MPAFETVVFDLDGTLLDTLEDLHLSTNAALAANGLPPRTLDEVRRFVGNGIRLLIERAVPDDTPADVVDATFASFKAHYGAHCEDHTGPYPGVPELLAHLKAAGVRIAVVSNKADFAVQELVARQFPGTFDAVIGECEERGIRKKPAPDMVEEALRHMGAERNGMVYVGDSEVDVATAANVGCPCVGCAWGFRGRAALLADGAPVVADTPSELGRILLAEA
ncbi:HAD family hydrolase [Olsenella profusa]|uniref:HAD-IIIA family hydrolase n=1 Tax=Olsenella profusa TaxID=138595 RepID=A0ABS2F2N0_9ACTN|nr:HAD-IIIA family hydrolase [Olsenella profusa]MBM6775241.1 HAD-IIIA family hydrolase [Olsenella profusa]